MMRFTASLVVVSVILLTAPSLWAKIDLVTLPDREKVQLTIYNSADLTLVRESRPLTLKKGGNSLQFSWANTLIDPTSLELAPLSMKDKINVFEMSYPARVRQVGVWNISADISEKVPMEVTFFTSGISWRAFYLGTLDADEKTMRLEGFVRVTNNSGEDYENAQTRLVIGQINILDQIAVLARTYPPFGRPTHPIPGEPEAYPEKAYPAYAAAPASPGIAGKPLRQAKEIMKEGLSEYQLYTIEGTETILNGWSKRLPSFKQDGIPVINLYRYDEERYGKMVVRFLSFANDEKHKLGKEVLPDGTIKIFQTADDQNHLRYIGQDNTKYIPIGEKAELKLGRSMQVGAEPVLMEFKTENHLFNSDGNISGWDEVRTYKVRASNYRAFPVKVEIYRNFPHQYWELKKEGEFGDYEKIDLDTVKFTPELPPNTNKVFQYTLRQFEGLRRSNR